MAFHFDTGQHAKRFGRRQIELKLDDIHMTPKVKKASAAGARLRNGCFCSPGDHDPLTGHIRMPELPDISILTMSSVLWMHVHHSDIMRTERFDWASQALQELDSRCG